MPRHFHRAWTIFDEIVAMYALVNRIRLFASASVLEAAEAFVKKLVERFGEKNMSLDQIKSVALEQHADPLNDFALKCRAELRAVYARASWRGGISASRPDSCKLSLASPPKHRRQPACERNPRLPFRGKTIRNSLKVFQ
jgi:hypothetical protein